MAYPQDHEPRHVHAFIGGRPKGRGVGEVIIDLRDDRTVLLADRDDAVTNAKASEVRKVVDAAARNFDRLVAEWDKMHGNEEKSGEKKRPAKVGLAAIEKGSRGGRKRR